MTLINDLKSSITPPVQNTNYLIGSNLLANLHQIDLLKELKYTSFLLLSDMTIFKIFGDKVVSSLEKLGKPVTTSLIEPGEKHKVLSEISSIVLPFFKKGFNRHSCVIAFGGGVITDLGGFVASILLRGIDAIYLPTTLLAQIDAAIGGKTGVDFAVNNLMLKNMIGTISQPRLVISDVDALSTLPKKEILNGLGEMAKYWIGWDKPSINKILKIKNKEDKETLIDVVSECQRIKLNVIKHDPYESNGVRQKLNLGHTIGHAIEGSAGGKLSHGEAVSIGLTAAARISMLKGLLNRNTYQIIITELKKIGLPTNITNIDKENVLEALKMDKKGGTFVLIKDIGKIIVGVKVDEKTIKKVLTEIIH